MKTILIGLMILIGQIAVGQSYDDQMNKAGEALQKKISAMHFLFFRPLLKTVQKLELMILPTLHWQQQIAMPKNLLWFG
jgi:hypothetical protein